MLRHAIDVPERITPGQKSGQLLLQALLDGPWSSHLTPEGRPIDVAQAGKGVVAAKVPKQSDI